MPVQMALSTEEAVRKEVRSLLAATGSQRQLAKRLRISQASVSDFLAGGGIGEKMLEAVLRETGKTLRELTHGPQPIAHVVDIRPGRRSFTPTPTPSSSLRSAGVRMDMPEMPANRERAIELMVTRGFERSVVDEEMAVAAMDAGLSPFEDRPVSWWIAAARTRLESRG